MQDINLLIDAYIDSSIDDEQFALLCDWLREDAEHRRTFAHKLALHSEIAEWCIERSGGRLAGNLNTAEAEAELPTIQYTTPDALTKQKYMSALSYVLRHTFTPKRVVMLATAAALLLGVVLTIVLLSGPDEGEPIVEVPAAQRIVATLTAEHNVVWDRRPGQDLYAGQRFTLHQGFAEITTARGARAILEAPCTVELTDGDNEIRLHQGKVIGLCHNEASRGFVVRTSHADITDIGTEFGVVVHPSNGSEVHVFDGLVELVTRVDGVSPVRAAVHTNESIRVSSDGELTPIPADPGTFALSKRRPIPVFSTGVGAAEGAKDPRWRVTAVDGKALEASVSSTVIQPTNNSENVRYLQNNPELSQWVWAPDLVDKSSTLRFETGFDIEGFDPATVELHAKFIADNSITAILINGEQVDVPAHSDGPPFDRFTELTIRDHFVRGRNSLAFVLKNRIVINANDGPRPKAGPNWFGLIVELEMTGESGWRLPRGRDGDP